ncbi:hypothetical protein HDU79_001505 [Rhizoclosmatium sp. JEL0117]|nr:hypothetical protein HDU79_001505 [Rhizoclosmatium sp. JEL0117]
MNFLARVLIAIQLAAYIVQSGPADAAPKIQLTYFGGPVIPNIEVFTIFIGQGQVQHQKTMNAFYSFFVRSPVMDMLAVEYSTPLQNLGYGKLVGTRVELNSSLPNTVAADDKKHIQPYFADLIRRGIITPNANTYIALYLDDQMKATQCNALFLVFLISDKRGTTANLLSCRDFCAYHGVMDISSLTNTTKYLYYGVFPDLSMAGCNGNCGMDQSVYNNMCSIAAHEAAEAITDAAAGLATSFRYPLGWYAKPSTNFAGGEIADICNGIHGKLQDTDGTTYTTQQLWSNIMKKCVTQLPKDIVIAESTKKRTVSATKTVTVLEATVKVEESQTTETRKLQTTTTSYVSFTSGDTSRSFITTKPTLSKSDSNSQTQTTSLDTVSKRFNQTDAIVSSLTSMEKTFDTLTITSLTSTIASTSPTSTSSWRMSPTINSTETTTLFIASIFSSGIFQSTVSRNSQILSYTTSSTTLASPKTAITQSNTARLASLTLTEVSAQVTERPGLTTVSYSPLPTIIKRVPRK